jgi:predicted HTH transcriptional regulator
MAVLSDDPARQLIAILRRGYESKDLDYKGPMSWDETGKETCCGLVKDILGMANTAGGFIVIGVSETPTGFSWDGLSATQLQTFETSRVNRFLQNYAEPPINALLRKINHENKTFVIVEIPEFPDTPVCSQNQITTDRGGVLAVNGRR